MEAVIHILVSGCYAGEYIAECAGSKCGYLGLFISQDRRESLTLDQPSTVGENVQQDRGPCQEIPSERFVAESLLVFTMKTLKSNKIQEKLFLRCVSITQRLVGGPDP